MKRESHGMRWSPEYAVWVMAKQRCHNPRNAKFADYGARGISVCQEWRDSFIAFYRCMGARPEGLTLERIDNDGDYSPGNCKWATPKEQRANTRESRLFNSSVTRIKGVSFDGSQSRFAAYIQVKGKQTHLGSTKNFFEACCLRKSAEHKLKLNQGI